MYMDTMKQNPEQIKKNKEEEIDMTKIEIDDALNKISASLEPCPSIVPLPVMAMLVSPYAYISGRAL